MKLKKLLLVCGLGLSYSVIFAANASVPEYDNVPITPQTWQEVDLTYDKYIDGEKYTETANILRPIDWLEKRKFNKHGDNLVHLSQEDLGADIIATVVAIKPININFDNRTAHKSTNRPVIGTFLKYSNQVSDYTFEDTRTGKRETIQATPEHPFYSVDRHDYVEIGQIWRDSGKYNGKEQLRADNGNNVILVKAKPHNGKVEAVYNFEVYKSHNYLVGNGRFLAHNSPDCAGREVTRTNVISEDGTGHITAPDGRIAFNRLGDSSIPNGMAYSLFADSYAPEELTWLHVDTRGLAAPVQSHPSVASPYRAINYNAWFKNKPVYFYDAGHGSHNFARMTEANRQSRPQSWMPSWMPSFVSMTEHADFIKKDYRFQYSEAVCLLTCHAADSGFGQNMANLLQKPVIAGNGNVILFFRGGTINALGTEGYNGNIWQTFLPQ